MIIPSHSDSSGAKDDGRIHPPPIFWLIPLLVAALRTIPFVLTRIVTAPEGKSLPAVGYNPLDWFMYVGFIRQAAETGSWVLTNPHTTLPQDGRFILPFFGLLGHVCRWTGADPFWVLELSRVPLIFAFFAVLWYFLRPFLPDSRQRLIASTLVAFAGGLEFLPVATFDWWPANVRNTLAESLSDDQGWNTFAAFNNPLWVAALIPTLFALRPLLMPAGTQRRRDWCVLAISFVAAYFIHPYSALAILGVAVFLPVFRWIMDAQEGALSYLGGAGAALGSALLVIVPVARWQNSDPVYRLAAGHVLGDHQLSVFWYPIGLGVLGLLAVRGWRDWIRRPVPGRMEVAAWTLAIVFMHTSPIFNGYHFIPYLHLPLCIVAATAFDVLLQRFDNSRPHVRVAIALATAALFQSALCVTWRSAGRALSYQVPDPIMASISRLAQEPPGRVYTSPTIGTLIPAYTSHRVYVGHWFLTPDHSAKQSYFMDLLEGRAHPKALVDLIQSEAIDYVLLPPATPPYVVEAIRPQTKEIVPIDGFILAKIRRQPVER